jgi:hypothetical protein
VRPEIQLSAFPGLIGRLGRCFVAASAHSVAIRSMLRRDDEFDIALGASNEPHGVAKRNRYYGYLAAPHG